MWWTATFQPEWTVSLLPTTATPWARIIEAVDADLAARDPVSLITVARDPDTAPLAWLPYMAAERSVDYFDGTWPEARQRAVIKASFAYHQVKGTRPAFDRALRPMGYDVTVSEWFEHNGDPYTFRLTVDLGLEPWTAKDSERIRDRANEAKNAHTKLDLLALNRRVSPALVYVGGYVTKRRRLLIKQQPTIVNITARGLTFIGGAVRIRRRLLIKQRVV